jgi:hypothetical protein
MGSVFQLNCMGTVISQLNCMGTVISQLPSAPQKKCRNTEGFFKCLGDTGLNFGVGFIPGVGLTQAITGTEVTAFQDVDIVMTGPSAAGLSDAGSRYAIYEFDALGGQAQLDKYNSIHKRNGLGTRPNAVRRSLSNLRIVGKSFGTIGNLLGLLDVACEINDCYKKHCEK